MKSLFILFFATLFIQFSGYGQFPLYVFPTTVSGVPYGDTIINTRALILKEGIIKIYAWQTLPAVTKTFASKTIYYNKNGSIEATNILLGKFKDITLSTNDTFFYDNSGREIEIKTTDTKNNLYPSFTTNYINGQEFSNYTTNISDKDTLTDYKYNNEKGQMIKLRQIRKGQPDSYSLFYYNQDGLFDSIHYENSEWGTFVFKRSKKGSKKIIEMENKLAAYKWIYNFSGQCLIYKYSRKVMLSSMQASNHKSTFNTEVNYYYNVDGTLEKVTQQSTDIPKVTMYYSYEKGNSK